jgi:hypothetical protein
MVIASDLIKRKERKMMRLVIANLIGLIATPCLADGFVAPPPALPAVPNWPAINHSYHRSLEKLRQEAIAQRARDGGSLSAASTATLQMRLDVINREYEKQQRNARRSTINLLDNSWR